MPVSRWQKASALAPPALARAGDQCKPRRDGQRGQPPPRQDRSSRVDCRAGRSRRTVSERPAVGARGVSVEIRAHLEQLEAERALASVEGLATSSVCTRGRGLARPPLRPDGEPGQLPVLLPEFLDVPGRRHIRVPVADRLEVVDVVNRVGGSTERPLSASSVAPSSPSSRDHAYASWRFASTGWSTNSCVLPAAVPRQDRNAASARLDQLDAGTRPSEGDPVAHRRCATPVMRDRRARHDEQDTGHRERDRWAAAWHSSLRSDSRLSAVRTRVLHGRDGTS